MASDKTAIGLGVPFLILIAIIWLTSSSHSNCYPPSGYPWIYTNIGGFLISLGLLFLIPVFILTIIFISAQKSSCESVAFGFGLFSWLLIIVGAIIGFYYSVSNYLIPALFILFVCPQIVLGFGLFARRNYEQNGIPQPTQRPYGVYPSRTPALSRPSPRGRVVIPEEVRMSGTSGQSVKQCVRCKNTLDIKTQVCYFCGARQSSEPIRVPPQQSLPTTSSHPTPQAPSPSASASNYAFCPSCGAKVFRGHLFCTQCGSSLEL